MTKSLPSLLAMLFMGSLLLLSVARERPNPPITATVPTYTAEPDIGAQIYFVKLIGASQPLLKRREWKKFAPASLTKLLTAVIAKEELLPADWVTISEDAKKTGEKLSKTKVGERFLRDDAIRLALIGSANDAALSLAERVGEKYGGNTFKERLEIFKKLSAQKAVALGLINSSFQNPTGLDESNHFSTAEDLARLAEYIWFNRPNLWEISRIIQTEIYSEEFERYEIKTTNELLQELPSIIGGKTGFTDKAKGALLLLVPVHSDRIAVIVLLGSEDRFGDGRKIIQWLNTNFK